MRVLLIDPWGINNTSEYLNGLIFGFSGLVELTVCTNVYFEQYVQSSAIIKKVFFKKSEKMQNGRIRKIVRGLEYINGYRQTIKEAKRNKYDIIHINWLLNYKLDILFLKIMSKYCNKLVYTAHNVLPHVNGDKYKRDLKRIYSIVDCIIVHGMTIQEELMREFPETKGKIYIQKHGCVIKKPPIPEKDCLRPEIKRAFEDYSKVFISCGAVFPNKGIDRLVYIWLNNYARENACLIVGGRQTSAYPEYEKLKPLALKSHNIIMIDGYIDEAEMNCLFSMCTAIVLPYRHASMSGIVFSAAQYKKNIISTKVGSIIEYLDPGQDSLVCENNDQALKKTIDIALEMDNDSHQKMGFMLWENISNKCDWRKICSGVLEDVYNVQQA